jgi:hypothetical protein
MTHVSRYPNEPRGAARVALALAVAAAVATTALVIWLPTVESRAQVTCGQPSPTETPTETPSPDESPNPPTDPNARFVTLAAARTKVTIGSTVTMTGTLGAADGTCLADQRVDIMATTLGTELERRAGRAVTNSEGAFTATVKVAASAVYKAVAVQTKESPAAESVPVTVLSKVIVQARTRTLNPERGRKIEIRAQVKPQHSGSFAALQRKVDGRWIRVKRDKADVSGFTFKLKASWKGKRVFRVTWIKSDEDHEPASSNRLRIKTKPPRERNRPRNRG